MVSGKYQRRMFMMVPPGASAKPGLVVRPKHRVHVSAAGANVFTKPVLCGAPPKMLARYCCHLPMITYHRLPEGSCAQQTSARVRTAGRTNWPIEGSPTCAARLRCCSDCGGQIGWAT